MSAPYITELGKQRMNRLISRLEKVKAEQFDITTFYDTREAGIPVTKTHTYALTPEGDANLGDRRFRFADGKYDRDSKEYVNKSVISFDAVLDEGFCGSTACVLGHAGLIKEFNEQGLGIYMGTQNGEDGDTISSGGGVYFVQDGVAYEGTAAGARFFEIPKQHSESLFWTSYRVASGELYGSDYLAGKPVELAGVIAGLKKYVESDGVALEEILIRDGYASDDI